MFRHALARRRMFHLPWSEEQRQTPEVVSEPAPSASANEAIKEPVKPPARIQFVITPWGEIYVDGIKAGVSPPMKVLELPAGEHVIEIRNTKFRTRREVVDL